MLSICMMCIGGGVEGDGQCRTTCKLLWGSRKWYCSILYRGECIIIEILITILIQELIKTQPQRHLNTFQ